MCRFVFGLSVQLLKYFQAEMALRFRQRLTEHVMEKYMKGFNFYAVSNLDDRLSNADQVLVCMLHVTELTDFCTRLCWLTLLLKTAFALQSGTPCHAFLP